MLTEVAEIELADMPQMQTVRRTLLEKARTFYVRFLAQRRTDPTIRREAGRCACPARRDRGTARRSYRIGTRVPTGSRDPRRPFPRPPHLGRRPARPGRGHDCLGMLLKKSNRFRESEAELRTALRLRATLDGPRRQPGRPARPGRHPLPPRRAHLAAPRSTPRG